MGSWRRLDRQCAGGCRAPLHLADLWLQSVWTQSFLEYRFWCSIAGARRVARLSFSMSRCASMACSRSTLEDCIGFASSCRRYHTCRVSDWSLVNPFVEMGRRRWFCCITAWYVSPFVCVHRRADVCAEIGGSWAHVASVWDGVPLAIFEMQCDTVDVRGLAPVSAGMLFCDARLPGCEDVHHFRAIGSLSRATSPLGLLAEFHNLHRVAVTKALHVVICF